jgi:hypothetical protein
MATAAKFIFVGEPNQRGFPPFLLSGITAVCALTSALVFDFAGIAAKNEKK